jgi:hypothetical protein
VPPATRAENDGRRSPNAEMLWLYARSSGNVRVSCANLRREVGVGKEGQVASLGRVPPVQTSGASSVTQSQEGGNQGCSAVPPSLPSAPSHAEAGAWDPFAADLWHGRPRMSLMAISDVLMPVPRWPSAARRRLVTSRATGVSPWMPDVGPRKSVSPSAVLRQNPMTRPTRPIHAGVTPSEPTGGRDQVDRCCRVPRSMSSNRGRSRPRSRLTPAPVGRRPFGPGSDQTRAGMEPGRLPLPPQYDAR